MKTAFVVFLVVLLLLLAALCVWRALDHRADRVEIARLSALQPMDPPRFEHAMVADLPEPARRYLLFAIKEGTPLYTVAEISMRGQFGLGDKDRPNYMPMRAEQVLAAPEGFVWKMSGGAGAMRISGSDSATWTRFWMAGGVPVARAGGTSDHTRSAFGRAISEATFWTPAVLLPRTGAAWEAIDANTARVTVSHKGMQQAVDLNLDADGRPLQVSLQRWSNANADGVFRLQPFGGTLSEYREFSGFMLPTHVEAGNMFGTDAYFPFFIADVSDVRFPS